MPVTKGKKCNTYTYETKLEAIRLHLEFQLATCVNFLVLPEVDTTPS